MTLSDVLKQYNNQDFEVIEYRHIKSIDSDDVEILYGFATYKNKMLMSVDGDSYHLSDNVLKHQLYKDNWLVVWV